MVLAKFMPDRSTPIEPESHSPMKNTAKTTSPAFLKRSLQFNNLQSSLMFRVRGIDHAIQAIADLFQKLMGAERFFHEIGIVAQRRVFAEHFVGVTAVVNNLEPGFFQKQ